jgi:hypothetical protein
MSRLPAFVHNCEHECNRLSVSKQQRILCKLRMEKEREHRPTAPAERPIERRWLALSTGVGRLQHMFRPRSADADTAEWRVNNMKVR